MDKQEYMKLWRESKREHIKNYNDKYKREHHQECCDYSRKYRKDNAKRVREFKRSNIKNDVGIIYGIRSKVDGKIVYVGETITKLWSRKSKHKDAAFNRNSQYPIHVAMREYGWDNFQFFVIDDEYHPLLTEEYYIDLIKPKYNSGPCKSVRSVRQ